MVIFPAYNYNFIEYNIVLLLKCNTAMQLFYYRLFRKATKKFL